MHRSAASIAGHSSRRVADAWPTLWVSRSCPIIKSPSWGVSSVAFGSIGLRRRHVIQSGVPGAASPDPLSVPLLGSEFYCGTLGGDMSTRRSPGQTRRRREDSRNADLERVGDYAVAMRSSCRSSASAWKPVSKMVRHLRPGGSSALVQSPDRISWPGPEAQQPLHSSRTRSRELCQCPPVVRFACARSAATEWCMILRANCVICSMKSCRSVETGSMTS
jgi:hypothetical protein